MKSQLSSLDVFFLEKEFVDLVGARIDKVFQIGEREIKIDLRAGKKKELIVAPAYLCLTKYKHETPRKPSNFAMIMRKLLGGGIIESVTQHRFDRVLEIKLSNKGTLILEFFSRGNIIFVDESGVIKAILEGQEWKDRTLRVGMEYVYPPQTSNIKDMNLSEFMVFMAEKNEIVKILATKLGLGAIYANEAVKRAGLSGDELPDKATAESIYLICMDMLSSKIDARIIRDSGEDEDVVPFSMLIYDDCEEEKKESFNDAIDDYFSRIRSEGIAEGATSEQNKEIIRLGKVVEKQKKTIDELYEKADKNRASGDLIYANFQDIDALLKGVSEAKRGGSNWYDYLSSLGYEISEPAERKFEFKGVGIYVDKSVTDNAGFYYDRAKKAKAKASGAQKALRKSIEELKEAEESEAKAKENIVYEPTEKRKQMWYEKFRWFESSDGFLVIGGKDATTNEILIKKHLEDGDLVFHSTVHGAPFFIIKNPEGANIPESTKTEAAIAAASYSSAWNAGWGSADVYCVTPDQVSKTPQSGEYLSKGAFVIRGEREWFKNMAMRIAVGFKIGDDVEVVGGPESAVSKHADYYVSVGVGNMKSGQIAKDIKKTVLRKTGKEEGQQIKKVDLGEIQKWIPAGKGMLA